MDYSYDEIGNLVADESENITNIGWTVYGKIHNVTKGVLNRVAYTYDPGGNRVYKDHSFGLTSFKTFYIRDVQGNVLAVYTKDSTDDLKWKEQHLYGSSRLGMFNWDTIVPASPPIVLEGTPIYDSLLLGSRTYELTNHLGNILATISDKKVGNDSSGVVNYYIADVLSENDYYPFGMQMPEKKYNARYLYRYGFNGKEIDIETSSTNIYDYGFRIYNSSLGRFLSVDPLSGEYPWYTPYQFAGNTPIQAVDLDGEEPRGYNLSDPYIATHAGTGVKFIPSSYDGKVYEHKDLGIVTAYAVQDIDEKYYLIFESAMGSKQFWYREYDKNGWKGNVNNFVWQSPPNPANVLTAITVGPIVAMPALAAGGFAIGSASLSTGLTNVATRGVMTYWRWAPVVGAAGRALAEFLDESGSAGMSNASRWAKMTIGEQMVAKTLLETGRDLKLLSPSDASKTADFLINGVKTELKTLTAKSFNANTAVTKITEGFKQGTNVLLDARKYDLSEDQVKSIYDRVKGALGGAVPGKVEIWTQGGGYKF